MRPRGGRAREPDISLLGMMFNVQTAQDLKREARRGAPRGGPPIDHSRGASPRAPARHQRDAGSNSRQTATWDDLEPEPLGHACRMTDTENEEPVFSDGEPSRRDNRGQASGANGLHAQGPSPGDRHTPQARVEARQSSVPWKPMMESGSKAGSVDQALQLQTPGKQPRRRLQKRAPKPPNASTSAATQTLNPPQGVPSAQEAASFTAMPAYTTSSELPWKTPYVAPPFPRAPPCSGFAFAPQPPAFPAPPPPPSCFPDPSTYVAFQAPVPCFSRGSAPTQAETGGQSGHFFLELQLIQERIDQVNAMLTQNPEDGQLQREMQKLQGQLNSTLNSATAPAGLAVSARQPENAPSTGPREQAKETNPSAIPMESSQDARNTVVNETVVQQAEVAQEEPTLPFRPPRLRSKSPGGAVWHHLCSACGEVRSGHFHARHPLVPGQKPLLNYCGPCKDHQIELGSITRRHHFCFGCGVVRSKAFQRNHAAKLESPLLPNYCGKCQMEVRDAESIVDASVVSSDFLSRRSSARAAASEAARSQGNDKMDGEAALCNRAGVGKASLLQRRRARRSSDTASAEHLRVTPVSHDFDPLSEGQSSSFCPSRRLGSAQRRAQRSSRAGVEDLVSPMSVVSEKATYHQPFVEDAGVSVMKDGGGCDTGLFSPLGSEEKAAWSISSKSGGKTASKSCFKGASGTSAPGPCSPPELGIADDYGRALGGSPDAGSSGGKTVKFRPFARSGNSQTRTPSNMPYRAELSAAEAGPDDATGLADQGLGYFSSLTRGTTRSASFFQAPNGASYEGNPFDTVPPYHGFDRGYPEPADLSSKFTRGAFGRDAGPANRVQRSSPRRDTYTPADDPPMYDEGFPRDFDGFSKTRASHADSYGDSSSYRSSRGAFSADFAFPVEDIAAAMRSEAPRGPTSWSPNADHLYNTGYLDEGMPKRHTYPKKSERSKSGRGEASSSRPSLFAHGSSANPGRSGPDGGSFDSAREDGPCSSSSTSNPYYKPGFFASAQEFFGRGRGSRPAPDRRVPDGWVPEPIIEEPYSPPESPVAIKMLGYDVETTSSLSDGEGTVCAVLDGDPRPEACPDSRDGEDRPT